MGRSTEQSYASIREYLQTRKLPATINDMLEANVASRSTLFRLLRPESFTDAALFGIRVLNNTKPYFFSYDSDLVLEVLSKVDKPASELVQNHKDVMQNAAKIISANAVVLDDLEQTFIKKMRKHRALYDKDDALRENFTKTSSNTDVADLLKDDKIQEVFRSDPLKMLAFLISVYVAIEIGDSDEPN